MKLPRIMLYALIGTFFAIVIPCIAYKTIHFSPVLSAQEKEILGFANTPLSLHTRGWKPVNRSCPVSSDTRMPRVLPSPSSLAINGRELNGRMTASGDTLPEVSFILHGDDARMAVVDGYVLKEGNSFAGWRLLRIEQKRVLIENRKVKKWITIDEPR